MSDIEIEKIKRSRKILGNPYAYLDGEGGYSAALVASRKLKAPTPNRFDLGNPYAYLNSTGKFDGNSRMAAIPRRDTEKSGLPNISLRNFRRKPADAARMLHKEIWRNRRALWPDGIPKNPVDMLDPEVAIRSLGYNIFLEETLGQYRIDGVKTEVAGTIDQAQKEVRISRKLPFVTRRFTTAHELGHALLHKQAGLHRDRPMDGQATAQRSRTEMEADQFASYFLMPEKLVKNRFSRLFGTDRFMLDDATTFMLKAAGVKNLVEKSISLRKLSRALASIQSYNGRHFDSLASQFHVSIEAMAIRLEELNLIDY